MGTFVLGLISETVQVFVNLEPGKGRCSVTHSKHGDFTPRGTDPQLYPYTETVWLFVTLAKVEGLFETAGQVRIILRGCTFFSMRDKASNVHTGIKVTEDSVTLAIDKRVTTHSPESIEMLPDLRRVLGVLSNVSRPLVQFKGG